MSNYFNLDNKSESYLRDDLGATSLEFIPWSTLNSERLCKQKGLVWHDVTIDPNSEEGYKVINATTEQLLKSADNSRSIWLQHKMTGSIVKSQNFLFNGFANELPKFKACIIPCHGRKPCVR